VESPANGDRFADLPWADAPAADLRDDAELVALAQADRLQFAHLYRRYFDSVHRYCHRRLGEVAAAEDATSVTFTKAFERIDSLRDGAGFKGWLFAIARNAVNDDYRSRRPSAPFEDAFVVPDDRPSPEEVAIAGEEQLRIWALLRQLKPDDQDIVALRLEGLNHKEIATALGRSHGTIRNKQPRIMNRLKTLLGIAAGEGVRRDER
jgi:RNA polymerase sigma-70 factor (ECF subfamily)